MTSEQPRSFLRALGVLPSEEERAEPEVESAPDFDGGA
jgi:hypothetical protein